MINHINGFKKWRLDSMKTKNTYGASEENEFIIVYEYIIKYKY